MKFSLNIDCTSFSNPAAEVAHILSNQAHKLQHNAPTNHWSDTLTYRSETVGRAEFVKEAPQSAQATHVGANPFKGQPTPASAPDDASDMQQIQSIAQALGAIINGLRKGEPSLDEAMKAVYDAKAKAEGVPVIEKVYLIEDGNLMQLKVIATRRHNGNTQVMTREGSKVIDEDAFLTPAAAVKGFIAFAKVKAAKALIDAAQLKAAAEECLANADAEQAQMLAALVEAGL